MKFRKVCRLALGLALAAAPAMASGVGKPARDFTITTLDKQQVRLSDLKGKVVVVNRWATWCTPCKAEMAAFENFMRTHPDTDLKIFAVTTELQYSASKLRPLQGILHYPIATNVSGSGYRVMDGVPTSYIIDRAGVVRFAGSGAFDLEGFEAAVTPLLKEPAPTPAPVAAP
ncbi:TlpA family protein disulfide reductase [Phenylobacterium sp.]|uniref:TlpA family protein disulfide reductase n=1 Tax=Phenylobacterium sp. TaxID=1871053 RepID=UPI00374D5063